MVVLNGAHLESGLAMVDLPLSRTIKTSRELRGEWLRYPEGFGANKHRHGPSGMHQHMGFDGHTWMSPRLLKRQLEALANEMKRKGFELRIDRLTDLKSKLDQLWRGWLTISPQLRERRLLCNHPAYQYLARDLKLDMIVFDIDPDQPVPTETLIKVSARLNNKEKKSMEAQPLMWWESEPSKETKESLKIYDLKHVVVSPLEHQPPNQPSLMNALFEQLNRVHQALDK